MGRTAGKLEDLERTIDELRNFSSNVTAEQLKSQSSSEIGSLKTEHSGTFKVIGADRLQFRGTPDFDLRPYLDACSKTIYDEPFATSMLPEEFEGTIRRVRVHCSREERLKLFALLDKSHRIKLVPRHQIRLGFEAGVFAVLKSLELDRMILDSRPHNLLESPPGRFIRTLGAGDMICKILLLPHEDL